MLPNDQPQRVGVVGVAQKGDLLWLAPLLELAFCHGGGLVEVTVQVLGMCFERAIVHTCVLDVLCENTGKDCVSLVEFGASGPSRDDNPAQHECARSADRIESCHSIESLLGSGLGAETHSRSLQMRSADLGDYSNNRTD